jgi:hypothetical protein
VQRASCSIAEDEERMLAVIEGCGAGFDAFNSWMHNLLWEHSIDGQHHAMDGHHHGALGALRRGRSALSRGHVVPDASATLDALAGY